MYPQLKTLEMWISSLLVNLLFPGKFIKFHESGWCMKKSGNLKFYAPFHEKTLILVLFQEEYSIREKSGLIVHSGYSA